jgi:hypothetical protein
LDSYWNNKENVRFDNLAVVAVGDCTWLQWALSHCACVNVDLKSRQ